tara:strand:+ start:126 stop:419 length:294 start_codon:yes stop_codon:yes gene_type:complete
MAELSPMAVAVVDGEGETDVYFDTFSYKRVYPRLWRDRDGGNYLIPPGLRGTGLGVLPGLGRFPPVRSYDDALGFARGQLKPVADDAQYYDSPREIV